jgi:hypothetical protein
MKMVNHRRKVGFGAVGAAIAMALVPAGTSSASSHKSHHKSHHKSTAGGAASCPSPTTLGTAAGTTFTGPTTEKAAEKGWVVCDYSTKGEVSLLVSLYTTDDSLRSISSNAPAATTKISGLGNAASHFGTIVFVQRDSAPSFSVIDESGGNLTLHQTEAIAKAIVAS